MAGIDGFGTTLAKGDGAATEVFSPIANVTSITAPGLARDTVETTAHDSPDQYREFLGGLKDPGEVSADVNYDPSAHDSFVDDLDTTDPINYQITFPDGTIWEFGALLTGFEASAPMDDKLGASLTWKVTGKPTITPAV